MAQPLMASDDLSWVEVGAEVEVRYKKGFWERATVTEVADEGGATSILVSYPGDRMWRSAPAAATPV